MSLHTAEQIAAEVSRRVATCTKAQGAETDLAAQVYLGRIKITDDEIPCVTIIEGPDDVARTRTRTEYELAQVYTLYAYVPCDPSHPNTAAHAAIRDLKRAIFRTDGKPDQRLGGNVLSVEYQGREIGPRADGQAYVVGAIRFAAQYVEDVANP